MTPTADFIFKRVQECLPVWGWGLRLTKVCGSNRLRLLCWVSVKCLVCFRLFDCSLYLVTRDIRVKIRQDVARCRSRAAISTNGQLARCARMDVFLFDSFLRSTMLEAFLTNCQEGSGNAHSCPLLLGTQGEGSGRDARVGFRLVRVLHSYRYRRANIVQAKKGFKRMGTVLITRRRFGSPGSNSHRDTNRFLYRFLHFFRIDEIGIHELRAFAMVTSFLRITSEQARRHKAILLDGHR